MQVEGGTRRKSCRPEAVAVTDASSAQMAAGEVAAGRGSSSSPPMEGTSNGHSQSLAAMHWERQRRHALQVARHGIQMARTDAETYRVVRTLALALGATRTEIGTIKALRAVLLQLERPGMSDKEACNSTEASMSNFTKWRRRVCHTQLDHVC